MLVQISLAARKTACESGTGLCDLWALLSFYRAAFAQAGSMSSAAMMLMAPFSTTCGYFTRAGPRVSSRNLLARTKNHSNVYGHTDCHLSCLNPTPACATHHARRTTGVDPGERERGSECTTTNERPPRSPSPPFTPDWGRAGAERALSGRSEGNVLPSSRRHSSSTNRFLPTLLGFWYLA